MTMKVFYKNLDYRLQQRCDFLQSRPSTISLMTILKRTHFVRTRSPEVFAAEY